jgi:TolB-like protein/Tfp pilus assembly protein PilF
VADLIDPVDPVDPIDDAALLKLADSVALGHEVDWAAETMRDGTDGELLEQLRIIDAMARLHRSHSTRPPSSDGPADHGPLGAGERWNHLVIAERVGGGTFGDVYRARDTRLDREVALKLLRRRAPSEALTSQILSEGRLLARVAHTNVITIYGAEEVNGRVGLWMEFIKGFTLEEVLRQSGTFSAREATFIGLDLCRALAAVHATGLVHRDVKAANVMREQGGRIVLMDFGTGQDLSMAGPEGRMAGTPLYLAPEIFRGEAATVRSDLYSLGVLLYRLTTGSYPISGTTLRDLAGAHKEGRFVRMRDARPTLPSAFVHVVERALSPAPEHRFQSAGAMDAALAGWLGIGARSSVTESRVASSSIPVARSSSRPSASVTAAPRRSKTRLAAGAAVAATVAILAAVFLWSVARRASAPPPAPPGPAGIRSIAVLPLRNLGGGDYFADGMTEALIADLGKAGVLDVISRTSVMRFKGSQQPLPEIAKALNVDAVIEGSVLRDGRKVRITAQLVDARTDTHLWANSYDRDVRDVLALQGDVARAIAREVHVTLTRKEEARLSTGRLQVSEEALDAYLQGRFYWNRRGGESLTRAMDYFEQAIRLEPNYAAAYAGLADTYILLGSVGGVMRPTEAMGKAKVAAQRALALDDSLGEAHTSLAMLHFWYDWDWATAETEFKRAISVNRSYPTAHHWYAIYLSAMGRHDEAVLSIDRATRLDPVSAIIRASRGWIEYQRRQFDAAMDESHRTLELDVNFIRAHNYLGMSFLKKGMPEDALREFAEANRLSNNAPVTQTQLASAYAVAGRVEETHRILTDLLRPGKYRYVAPADIAEVYVWMGDHDRAMDWLQKALDERSFAMVYMKVHPAYDPIRQDPRFVKLLERLHFP